MSPREHFTAGLVEWLNRAVAPPGVVIGPETELFAGRLIDSLRVLELIAWTEREIGEAIPDEMIRMDHFRSPRRIAEFFVKEEVAHVDR